MLEEGTGGVEWPSVCDAREKAANCAESTPSPTPRGSAAGGETCPLEGVSTRAFFLDGEYVVCGAT